MCNSSESVYENLYALFDSIGKNVAGVDFIVNDNLSSLTSISSAWPNAVYNINSSSGELFFQNLSSTNHHSGTLPVVIADHSDDKARLFQKNGYVLIDRWIGMAIESCENSEEVKNDLEFAFIDLAEEELDEWLSIASTNLFKGNSLDRDIFVFLIKAGNQLIGLKKNGRIIGVSMVFNDDMENAGIYMFCINKEERGKGYGKQLLNFTLNTIFISGKKKVVLQATRMGVPLYKSAGFIENAKIDLFIKKGI